MRTEFLKYRFYFAQLPKCVERLSDVLKWFVIFLYDFYVLRILLTIVSTLSKCKKAMRDLLKFVKKLE